MSNPYIDPTEGKSGSTLEILEALTTPELETYIKYLLWEQQHTGDSGSSVYQSASYYRYRSQQWIQTCREIIEGRKINES
jgi:hypothetical protein